MARETALEFLRGMADHTSRSAEVTQAMAVDWLTAYFMAGKDDCMAEFRHSYDEEELAELFIELTGFIKEKEKP